MAGQATTALTVDFLGKASFDSTTLRLERSNKESDEFKQVYFRAHGMDGHTLTATSGVLRREQANMSKFVSEFVYFQGETLAGLSYPGGLDVVFRVYGKMIRITGESLSSSNYALVFDQIKNAIKSTVPMYGVLLVEYTTPYELWHATFGGKCPSTQSNEPPVDVTKGSPDDDREYVGLDPMVVYGFKNSVLEASLPLEPPACEPETGGGVTVKSRMNSGSTSLSILIDPENPIAYQNTGVAGLEAGCMLRVYPSDANAQLEATAGKVYSSTEDHSHVVTEIITFNNTGSARLSYQPMNSSISSRVVGAAFIDEFNDTFIPKIKTWGSNVTVVTWENSRTYSSPQNRDVERDEIVCTTTSAKVMRAYGSVEVTYTTAYTLHQYDFARNEEGDHFVGAFIVGIAGLETANIALNPPAKRGYV